MQITATQLKICENSQRYVAVTFFIITLVYSYASILLNN